MKKYLFIMSAAALALAGCSEEQELVNAPASQENRVLTATFEQEATTRTSIDGENNNALTWSEGDAIAVFGTTDDEQAQYILTNGAGTASATFTLNEGATAPAEIAGAAFPYSQAGWDGSLTMNLLAELVQTSAGELNLPMWGTVVDGEIAFKHLAGVLKVNLTNLPEGYTRLIVTASNPISGRFTTETIDNELVLTSESTDANDKTVIVEFTNGDATTLYLPLPVGTYESIEVSVSDGDAKTKVLKKFSNLTVDRTKVYKTTVSDYTSVMTEEELRAAVAEGGTVTLGTDVTLSAGLEISNEVTIDLNNKTLTSTATDKGYITNTGTLTIKNGSMSFDGTAVWANGGELNLIGCEITETGTTGGDCVYVSSNAEVVISGCSIEATGTNEDSDDVWYGIGVVGGNVTVENTTVEGFHGGITAHSNSVLNIDGGKFVGTYWHGLNIQGVEVMVDLNNKPEFEGPNDRDVQVYQKTATINNVIFDAGIYTQEQVYEILSSVVMSEEELRTAVAKDGTVTLGANVTLSAGLEISNNVTLNLNGKTLTSTATDKGYITNTGTLTIKNGYMSFDGTAVWANGGQLNLIGCEITETGTTGGDCVYVSADATVVISGCSIEATGVNVNPAAVWYGIGVVGGNVTVENTTVEGFHGGITAHSNSVLNIDGGKFVGTYWHGLNIQEVGVTVELNNKPEFEGPNDRDVQVYQKTAMINEVTFEAGIYTQEQVYAKLAE